MSSFGAGIDLTTHWTPPEPIQARSLACSTEQGIRSELTMTTLTAVVVWSLNEFDQPEDVCLFSYFLFLSVT